MSKYIAGVFSQPWSTILQPWKLWRKDPNADKKADDAETPDPSAGTEHSQLMKTMADRFLKDERHPYLADSVWRQLVYRRFLVARGWDIEKAANMLREALEWRTKYGTDDIAFFPPPKGFLRGWDLDDLNDLYDRPLRNDPQLDRMLERLREGYHGTWHKWDRDGHPVYIERSGVCDPRVICNSGKLMSKELGGKMTWEDCMLKGHVLFMEIGCHLAHYQTRKLNKPIYQFTYICDMKGYSLYQVYQPVLNALKVIIENDKKNYPETTRYAFVVNAPSIVSIAWNFISPILDKRTADKVHIMGGNYQKKLHAVVDPKNLPNFLGGTCDCIGDCVPVTPLQAVTVFDERKKK